MPFRVSCTVAGACKSCAATSGLTADSQRPRVGASGGAGGRERKKQEERIQDVLQAEVPDVYVYSDSYSEARLTVN